ncbi:MAG: hypothetical protein KDB54_06220 [Solirubrobacterales bacterium]|nr:hypothetical protein [Solirubrobacterales bacterium]
MDPDQPKRDDRTDPPEGGNPDARRRAEGLTARQVSESRKSDSGKPERPTLTEKQRIEARRARQARRRHKPVEGNPLSKGMRATGIEIRRTASFLGGAVLSALAALGPAFSAAGMGLVWLIERAGAGLKALGRQVGRASAAVGRAVVALDRVITPGRALVLIAAVAAVLLGVAQFKGLGQIEIGQSGYSGFQDLAKAPAIDHTTPADVHTDVFVPIAVVAFAAALVILLGSVAPSAKRFSSLRRLASMLLVAIGLLTLAVALLVDLPDATDTAEASLAYSGVEAVLLSGFWLELAAGAALAASGFALLYEPSTGRIGQRHPESRREGRPRRAEGGSGSGTRAASGSGPAAGPATGSRA